MAHECVVQAALGAATEQEVEGQTFEPSAAAT